MRRWFLTLLLVLAAALAAFVFVEKSDGYILLAVAGYTVEMPLLLGVLALLLAYLVISTVISFIRAMLGTRRAVSGWVKNQRQQQSVNRTTQGLVAFIEGRWDYASKSLAKSARGSSTPFVNYLFAARASSELGDTRAVDGFLQRAEESSDEAGVAIGLTQAELQIQNHQYEKALATLLRVRQVSSNHPVAAKLLAQVYIALGDWVNLLKLLPSLDHDVISEDEARSMEGKACAALIAQAEKQEDLASLTGAWKQLPGQARKRPAIIAVYVQSLLRSGYSKEAESIVRNQLQRDFSSEMAELYGMTEDERPERQYAFAEKLAKSYESDSSLLLTLGRLAQRLNKPDKALVYFEKSLEQKPTAAVFAELAGLAVKQGDFKRSSQLYANAARLRGGIVIPSLAQE